MNSRLREARIAAGFPTAAAAAKRFIWPLSTYAAHENGQNKFGEETALIYGRAFKCSAAWLLFGEGQRESPRISTPRIAAKQPVGLVAELPHIPIYGKVAAGMWIEVETADADTSTFKSSPFPPDPRYPLDAQYDLIVEGTSINRFAQDGDAIRCVDILKAGIEIVENDLVIVSRTRATALRETTAKRVRKREGKFELWPESDDPRWQEPLIVLQGGADQHDETRIMAKVLWKYRAP